MKKFILISTLLISCFLLYGCDKQSEDSSKLLSTESITPTPSPTTSPIITVTPTTIPALADVTATYDNEVSNQMSIQEQLLSGKPVEIPNPYSFSLGYDDILDQISCEFVAEPEYPLDYYSYTLTVNDCSFTETYTIFSDKIYLMSLNNEEYLIIIHEVGYSDDNVLHLFCYNDEELIHLGNISGSPDDFHTNPDGTLTSRIRGNVLHTWYYDADFIISNYYYNYDDNSQLTPKIVQLPDKMYPMGTQVILKVDLPLYQTTDSDELSGIIPKGSSAILVACDDIEWLYVDSINPIDDEHIHGYVRFADHSSLWVNQEQLYGGDIFEGLCYAD